MIYDAVIAGGGTAGLYFALQLGKRGFKTLVLEKDPPDRVSRRLDIIHLPYSLYERFGIEAPKEGDGEFGKEFLYSRSRSAIDTYEKVNSNHVYAVHLPAFNARLANLARDAGAEIIYGARYKRLIRECSEIKGIVYEKDGAEYEAFGKLIADASGISSAVRRDIDSPYMETFEIGPLDQFYVMLKYVIYDDPANETLEPVSWPYYKTWIGPFHGKSGGIIGCGASTSFDYCKYMMEKFEGRIPRPSYKVDHFEYGSTPYTRTPYSFVADNFMALGDSAGLTNPMSGEGIEYHFEFIKETLDAVCKALEDNDTSVEKLWPVNVIYNRSVNAANQEIRASVVCLMKMNERENEYIFKKGIIFRSDDEPEPNTVKELIKGVLSGDFSLKALTDTASGLIKAGKIRRHYEKFPGSPVGYATWAKKADELWQKAGKITDMDRPLEVSGS